MTELPQKGSPFLKWPGGKRWAVCPITALIERHLTGTYFEPFLGGGAIFFSVRPQNSVLSDINGDLINTYLMVKHDVKNVMRELRKMKVSKEEYYRIRKVRLQSRVRRAARFLYLNRTAFSGLYRLNSKGQFNVPYGGGERTPEILLSSSILKDAARSLRGASVRECDFQASIECAGSGDVVYCDPTYTVTHNYNGFVRYNERNFSWLDQVRLANVAQQAAKRGATVIISNADHRAVRNLYRGAKFYTLVRNSTLSVDPSRRREVKELLIILKRAGDRVNAIHELVAI